MKSEVTISGYVSELQYSHTFKNEQFCTFKISSARTSGVIDILPCVILKKLAKNIKNGDLVEIIGDMRSRNIGRHLIIWAFVKDLRPFELEKNSVEIEGNLCKIPIYRVTPLGREIADLLIATNRENGKSAYIPVIAWGDNARYADTLNVGDKVKVFGRFQSRDYVKHFSNEKSETRTAYEVSITMLEKCEEERL